MKEYWGEFARSAQHWLILDSILCVTRVDGSLTGLHVHLKGAYVIINMHSIHMDPSYWIDPDTFRPERHIDSNGQIIQTDRLLPFGAGSFQI